MSRPRFRFTLNNSTEGQLIIKEPGGWDQAIIKLERHKEYNSLVEYYDQPLTFWSPDGGYDYIKTVESSQGVDASITILIELSDDFGTTWETVFDGVLALDTIKEIDFYKLECGVIRNDFWSKFVNRKGTPVDLSSVTSIDGTTVTAVSDIDIALTAQAIRAKFKRTVNYNPAPPATSLFTFDIRTVGTTSYVIFDNSRNDLDEIEDREEYGTQISGELPTDAKKYLFLAKYNGTYNINASIRFSFVFGASRNADVKWYYAYRQSGTLSTPTQIGSTTSVSGATTCPDDGVKTVNTSIDLEPGDEIYLWGELTLNSGTDVTYFPDYDTDPTAGYSPVYTSLEVTADTLYPDTEIEGFFIRDAALSILRKIISQNTVLTSTYFGSGCGRYFGLMKGLHLRGYTNTEKPFFMSFDDWWQGASPIFCIGLGYNNDQDEIEIEDMAYFYDQSTNSVNLSNVNKIERGYETDVIFRKIEIGYQKWESENISGIDDPQTKHTYATRFQKIGKDITLYSKFMAASLAIESTRRQTIEKSKDYKLDNDTFIISLNPTPISSVYQPELDENYSGVSNLLNSDTRYNLRLTPARNFLRWREFFNGCLQAYTSTDYKFQSGEGNFDMLSNLSEATCDGAIETGSLFEDQDIDVTTDNLFTHEIWEFEHPLTWTQYKAIRNNRTKSIGISRTGSGHQAFFVIELSYEITSARAKFKVLKA